MIPLSLDGNGSKINIGTSIVQFQYKQMEHGKKLKKYILPLLTNVSIKRKVISGN